MLTRVLCALLLWICVAQAEQEPPHVVLVQLEHDGSGLFMLDDWQHVQGECIVSPGKAAIQTALLFGTPPLEQGVVSDLDWRRKPINGSTLAHVMEKANYNTLFYGAWALGSTPPFDPKSRGFEQSYYFEDAKKATIADSWGDSVKEIPALFEKLGSNRVFFRHISQGHRLSREKILTQLKAWMQEVKEPAVVIILETSSPQTGDYHYSAKWYYFKNRSVLKRPDVHSDMHIYQLVMSQMTNSSFSSLKKNTFFHKANWPLHDAVEKNRYRGSLVVQDNVALVDGLDLYRAVLGKPDLTQPLDIDKNEDQHTLLLFNYAKWWQRASKALSNPRSFDVGEKDYQITRLTALDWRPSKIIDADEKSPISTPVVGQQYLLDLLAGLNNHPEYHQKFPAYSGSWSLNIKRSGRYKITASLLPQDIQDPKIREFMKLNGGEANIRLGTNVAQLNLTKGATAITLQTDADAGVTDLECWFTGQLPLTRELGAFFVEIERVGEKKYDIKPE